MAAFLLADIGGTNARFGILENGKLGCFAVMPVADFADPVAAIGAFLAREGKGRAPTKAILAAAGPVLDGRIALTNAAWVVDGDAIGRSCGMTSVRLVNDFAALVLSLPALTPGDLRAVGGGLPVAGAPCLVVGPGTGFGVGAAISGLRQEVDLASEGGHATLAAENRREDAIIQSLRQRFDHVSIERVLSGAGLARLYQAVMAVDGIAAPDRDGPAIVARALAGDCAASVATLELFCALLGSVAGDLALTFGARGGVYIGGGIVRRFADFLERSAFRRRFEAKGRMSPYLAAMPVHVILNRQPAFLGLARLAQNDPA